MSPDLRLVNPDGRPTMPFIAAWRAKGAVRGLPAGMPITKADGTPTGLLVGLARQGLGLKLVAADRLVDGEGHPTRSFLALWDALP